MQENCFFTQFRENRTKRYTFTQTQRKVYKGQRKKILNQKKIVEKMCLNIPEILHRCHHLVQARIHHLTSGLMLAMPP